MIFTCSQKGEIHEVNTYLHKTSCKPSFCSEKGEDYTVEDTKKQAEGRKVL